MLKALGFNRLKVKCFQSSGFRCHNLHPYAEGECADKFYILLKGSAVAQRSGGGKKSLWGRGGGPIKTRHYGPGAHFGELALLTGQPRQATVTAQEYTEVLGIDRNTLSDLRAVAPTLEDHIMRSLRHYDHVEQFTSLSLA